MPHCLTDEVTNRTDLVPERQTNRIIELGALAISLCLATWFFYYNREFYHDDAFITLRYARNFLGGDGVVWNPGEYVQGYSNFLQLMLISGLGFCGLDLELASRLIGIISYILLPAASIFLLKKICSNHNQTTLLLPIICLIASAPMVSWSLGGLESLMFTLLTSVGMLLFLWARQSDFAKVLYIGSGIMLALAALTRPDGLIFVAIAFLWLIVHRQNRLSSHVLHFTVPCGILISSYIIWQYCYYGDLFPNTFYVKGTTLTAAILMRGLSYLWKFTVQPPFLFLLTAAMFLYQWLHKELKHQQTYLATNIVAYSLFIVYAGGDHMPAFRLVLPLIPLQTYLLYMLLQSLCQATARRNFVIYTIVLLLLSLQINHAPLNPGKIDDAALNGTQVGKFISASWPANSLIALSSAGAGPYHAPGYRFIDMLGLNDRHIAKRRIDKIELLWQKIAGHLKGDGNYVLARKPDYIILGPSQGTTASEPWFLSDLEINRNPEFHKHYEKHVQVIGNSDGRDSHRLIFTFYKRSKTGNIDTQ